LAAHAFDLAALDAVPTLDQLIGQLEASVSRNSGATDTTDRDDSTTTFAASP